MTDDLILAIETMGAQGDGVTADGTFIPFTLPGERVLAQVAAGRGVAREVLTPSPDRVAPPCPHFGSCGGCALQHWAEGPTLAWKAERIRLALARERLETDILSPLAAPAGARRRLALHARRPGKGSQGQGAILGFKARRSWDLVPIATCEVAHPALVAALPALRALAAPFLEHPKSAPTLHVTLTETGLDVDVTGVERRGGGLSADARLRAAQAAAAGDFARVTLAGEIVYQARAAVVRLGRARVELPAGAFLQATAQAEREMAELAISAAAGARRIADLYCGVGTFTFALARIAPVMAADASAGAVAALRAAVASAPGLSPIAAQVRDLDRRPVLAEELAGVEVVLFDPPRAGAAAQCRQLAKSRVAKVIGVSCDPASFARDARLLVDGGYRLARVQPVDQFKWSPHIELVGLFTRERT